MEQFQDDGCNAAEVAGPHRAFQPIHKTRNFDISTEWAGRIHLLDAWHVDDRDVLTATDVEVRVEISRVSIEILTRPELRGIDENTDDDSRRLLPDAPDQRGVPFVKGSHRGNETDALAADSSIRDGSLQVADRRYHLGHLNLLICCEAGHTAFTSPMRSV
jgi:hypothetical protein